MIILELMAVPHKGESVGSGPFDQAQVLCGLLLDLEMCQQLKGECQWMMMILYLVVEGCEGLLLTEP